MTLVSSSQCVVFWDFDGTLARRRDLWSGALVDAWKSIDPACTATAQELRPYLREGFPWHSPEIVRPAQSAAQWWTMLRPIFINAYLKNGLDLAGAEAAASRVPTEFFRPEAWSVVDGAHAALRLTKDAGFRNIVLSNHAPELPQLISTLGLADHIELTITSATVGAEKPNSAIFDYARERVGIADTNTVWMIGDNPIADILGASQAGIRGILVHEADPNHSSMTVIDAAKYIVDNQRSEIRR